MKFSRADTDRLLAMAGLAPDPVHKVKIDDAIPPPFTLQRELFPTTTRRWSVLIERFHPTRLNVLMNSFHMEAARLKDIDAQMIAGHLYQAEVPAAYKVRRRVTLVLGLAKAQRCGDVDAYWKSTLDALVRCRALVDDSPIWCETTPIQTIRVDERSTRIILEDIDPVAPPKPTKSRRSSLIL